MIPNQSKTWSARFLGICRANKGSTAVMHRFSVGANVYYEPSFGAPAAPGEYKVVRQLPVERDNRLSYRIKSASESFERIAEEHQLSRGD
jgi:hypothetical protein